jgi:hypothetical protein
LKGHKNHQSDQKTRPKTHMNGPEYEVLESNRSVPRVVQEWSMVSYPDYTSMYTAEVSRGCLG